jgi:hypothetical protein
VQLVRDIAIFLSAVPSAIILWNGTKWQKLFVWPIIKFIPLAMVFGGLLLSALLIPSDANDHERDVFLHRYLVEFIIAHGTVLIVAIIIAVRAQYGVRGWPAYWSDVKARLLGDDMPRRSDRSSGGREE